MPLPNYRSYKNLPQLAGLCTVEQAAAPGLLIEACTTRLKRFHYAFKRLHGLLTARITSEPIYELKTLFSHHAYLCAEHVTALRQRVSEMREPPLGLDEVPHPALEAYFDEIQAAPTTELFVAGVGYAFEIMQVAMEQYQIDTHPLTDAPSKRVLKFARLEVLEMLSLITDVTALLDESPEWESWVHEVLIPMHAAAGTLDGTQPEGEMPQRRYSAKPVAYDPVPRRDERFSDPWNQGVNPEAFLYSDTYPARAKVLMMLYKRLREIDVPEMMASIIVQTPGKPWAYYRDMSRQLWDEARHAMMGEVGFVALGVDWTQARISWNWSYRLNTECTAKERHAVLFFIEQGLMPKTGKRYEYEVATQSGFPLAATLQDFDWADEVLHSQIGRHWYVPEFESLAKALEYGDVAWNKITSNWDTVKQQGLTQHENWWPKVYTQACTASGEEPDPVVLGYSETYAMKRADIHRKVNAE